MATPWRRYAPRTPRDSSTSSSPATSSMYRSPPSVVLEPGDWPAWLDGDEASARALMTVPPADRFDPTDAIATDQRLRDLGLG